MLRTLEGKPADVVPFAPLYLDIYLRSRSLRLTFDRLWRLTEEGPLSLGFESWLKLQLEIQLEVYSVFKEPHDWILLPRGITRRRVEGSKVKRENYSLVRETQAGERVPIPREQPPFRQGIDKEIVPRSRDDIDELLPRDTPKALLNDGYAELPRRFKRHITELAYIICGSPFLMAYPLLGFSGMMRTMVEEPSIFERLLSCLLEKQLANIELWKQMGAETLFVEEAFASRDIISEKHYEHFCFPFTRDLIKGIRDAGLSVVLYFTGDPTNRLGYLRELHPSALAFEESKKGFYIDIAEIRKELGYEECLFGNLDVALIERDGGSKIKREVERQIKQAGPGKFVLSVGSPPTPPTLPSKLDLLSRLAHSFGVDNE